MPTVITELGKSADLLRLAKLNPQKYPYLLASGSVDGAEFNNARFDILMCLPSASLSLYDHGLYFKNAVDNPDLGEKYPDDDFLKALGNWQAQVQTPDQSALDCGFVGGFLLYFAYEFAAQLDAHLALPIGTNQLLARAVRVANAVVYDRKKQTTLLIQESAQKNLLAIKNSIIADFALAARTPLDAATHIPAHTIDEEDPALYLERIARVKEYIGAGDVYQVNLSRQFAVELAEDVPSWAIFATLRARNPSPFAALIHFAELDIISASPERLVQVLAGSVETRPIAGTRFLASATALNADPKERAEHIMLVDLERNDLAKVADIGSVNVDELLVREQYRHVEHLVSNVRARLKAGVGSGAVVAALFPGGTITGCPKLRCMQILAELEAAPRAAYTGSLGYLNRDASMDLNIIIRTWQRHGQIMRARAGGGIVFDSNPDKELLETRAKARGMLAIFDGVD